MNFSKIGLGCVTFGREINEADSHLLLDQALARGVTMFDTAAAYGGGASEGILGRWLAMRRPAVVVATKILPPYEPRRIISAVEASLQRLGVDRLQLLYLHRWDATAESLGTLEALDALVRAGKVGALGASNVTQHQLATALALQKQHSLTRFSVVQNNHNLAVRDAGDGFRAFCATEDVSVITYSPLGAGFLTSKHQGGVAPGSRFDLVPGHQEVYFHDEAFKRLARLESMAARTGYSQAHLALAWALHQPAIATVLVGGRTSAHLDQAFAALAFDDAEVLAELGCD